MGKLGNGWLSPLYCTIWGGVDVVNTYRNGCMGLSVSCKSNSSKRASTFHHQASLSTHLLPVPLVLTNNKPYVVLEWRLPNQITHRSQVMSSLTLISQHELYPASPSLHSNFPWPQGPESAVIANWKMLQQLSLHFILKAYPWSSWCDGQCNVSIPLFIKVGFRVCFVGG